MFSKAKYIIFKLSYHFSKYKNKKFNKILTFSDVDKFYETRNKKYAYFHHFFWNQSPEWLLEHRKYFSQNKRGFGEDAFHAMWYFIFKEFRPVNILEIGVYRGQTLSLFMLLSKQSGYEANIHGISPFTSAGDKVSKYLDELDYYQDVINNFKHFELSLPHLHKGFSTEKGMEDVIQSENWDLIYIDGNHDYGVARKDFILCSQNLRKNGLLVLDDSALHTDFKPPLYATGGHAGPSRIALEIDKGVFKEIVSAGHNRVFKKIV